MRRRALDLFCNNLRSNSEQRISLSTPSWANDSKNGKTVPTTIVFAMKVANLQHDSNETHGKDDEQNGKTKEIKGLRSGEELLLLLGPSALHFAQVGVENEGLVM